jgi:uncharacterized protein
MTERASQARQRREAERVRGVAPLLLPDVTDPVSAPFWRGLRERVIVVQKCCACGAIRYPPLVGCPECLGREAEWVEVGPQGSVWSYAVYHRALQPAFADEIPYTVAVVELDGGPRITARMVRGIGPVAVGDRVAADFEEVSAEVTQLKWRFA